MEIVFLSMSPLRKPLVLEEKENRGGTLLNNLSDFVHSDIKYGYNSTERSILFDILIGKIFTNTFRSGLINCY